MQSILLRLGVVRGRPHLRDSRTPSAGKTHERACIEKPHMFNFATQQKEQAGLDLPQVLSKPACRGLAFCGLRDERREGDRSRRNVLPTNELRILLKCLFNDRPQ